MHDHEGMGYFGEGEQNLFSNTIMKNIQYMCSNLSSNVMWATSKLQEIVAWWCEEYRAQFEDRYSYSAWSAVQMRKVGTVYYVTDSLSANKHMSATAHYTSLAHCINDKRVWILLPKGFEEFRSWASAIPQTYPTSQLDYPLLLFHKDEIPNEQ